MKMEMEMEIEQSKKTYAYVTFLAGNGDYIKGVVGLAKGLRKSKSAYPLVVAVLPDVPEEHRQILHSQGCIVKQIETLHPPQDHQTQYAHAYYVINYSKLRIWEVSTYTQFIFMLFFFYQKKLVMYFFLIKKISQFRVVGMDYYNTYMRGVGAVCGVYQNDIPGWRYSSI